LDRKWSRKGFPKAKSQLNCDFAVTVQNARIVRFLLSQFGKFKFWIGFRCLHEGCRYGCYLSSAFGGTPFNHIEFKLWSKYYTGVNKGHQGRALSPSLGKSIFLPLYVPN